MRIGVMGRNEQGSFIVLQGLVTLAALVIEIGEIKMR